MKVEIWSDVMCPFCYIGKRKFEKALEQFPHAENVTIEWRSFLLDPELQSDGQTNVYEYLAQRKGFSVEQSKQMHQQVVNTAKEIGLEYNFDKAVVANSFDAHRLTHLAKHYGLGDAAEEALFLAYFTEGKNIADHDTLVQIAESIGLDGGIARAALTNNAYAADVMDDVREASTLGVRGVPFFVFDRKYAVSGAQQPEAFLNVLQTSFAEWQAKNPQPLM